MLHLWCVFVSLWLGPECDQWGRRPAAGQVLQTEETALSRLRYKTELDQSVLDQIGLAVFHTQNQNVLALMSQNHFIHLTQGFNFHMPALFYQGTHCIMAKKKKKTENIYFFKRLFLTSVLSYNEMLGLLLNLLWHFVSGGLVDWGLLMCACSCFMSGLCHVISDSVCLGETVWFGKTNLIVAYDAFGILIPNRSI